MEKINDKKVDKPKIWNESEVALLKRWGEISASYRLLHDRAFREFQRKSYGLTIPVIIMSTLSGTASFATKSFPEEYQTFVPMVIGGINIVVGIIQTITQFLRVNELTESHRVASFCYSKFSRNIITELSLPPQERSYNGLEYVQICRSEMDRLIEQSPIIPMHLLRQFENNKDFNNITKLDVLSISNIVEYKPTKDEKIIEIMSNVADKIHKNEKSHVFQIQEKIEKKINKSSDNEMDEELKKIVNNHIIDDIEKNIEINNINIDDLTNQMIVKRNNELNKINENKIVSKILKKKNKKIFIIKIIKKKLKKKNIQDKEIRQKMSEFLDIARKEI